jgi:thiamine biosynthesis lipoprotein
LYDELIWLSHADGVFHQPASGSLGQWREIEGQRYGHVIDPRNGRPLTRRLQALVVSKDAALADVMATAVLVLGEELGIELAQSLTGVEALLLDDQGNLWRTSGWDRETRFQAFPTLRP